jgi:hypothetical protein
MEVYLCKKNSENWNRLFDLLVEGNKIWAKNAAALVVLISRKNFEFNEGPSITPQLGAGCSLGKFSFRGMYSRNCYSWNAGI